MRQKQESTIAADSDRDVLVAETAEGIPAEHPETDSGAVGSIIPPLGASSNKRADGNW